MWNLNRLEEKVHVSDRLDEMIEISTKQEIETTWQEFPVLEKEIVQQKSRE